jgi:SAM-dependent methyltransferase
MVRGGDVASRIRAIRDGQAAVRLGLVAAGLRTGVLDALQRGPVSTSLLAERIEATNVPLLEAFLRVLEEAGLVSSSDGAWRLTRRAARALGDDVVRATYEAFAGYHTGTYRELHDQLQGRSVRHDIRDHGDLIARLSVAVQPLITELLTRTVKEHRPSRVLDVGCGAGLQLATMLEAAPGAQGIGVDVDEGAAALARRTLAERGLADRARVLTGGLTTIAASGSTSIGGPVDLALLANLIYYVPVTERAGFLAKIAELVRPGGVVLLITTAAAPSLFSRHFDLLLKAQEGAMELPDLDQLGDQLRQAGFAPSTPERLTPGEPLYAVVAVLSDRGPTEMGLLPYIDEHAVRTDATPGRAWTALLADLHRTSPRERTIARLLGCDPAVATATFTGTPGDSLPGFGVVEADPGRRLVLEGRHRFSQYRLELLIDDGRVRARTFAAFPGWSGRLYRALVIGTGGHRVATRNWLRRIARSA